MMSMPSRLRWRTGFRIRRLLSHDLFEGVFARAGLASDVEVVEEFPARYDVAASRHHRWTRGDWQLLPWILGRGPFANADRNRSAIPAMGRWKMLDNLRRTLSAPAAIVCLTIGWMLPLEAAAVWTVFVLATIALPTFIPVVSAIVPGRRGVELHSHIVALGAELRLALGQSALLIILLAHQAWSMTDAIVRTLARLFVTRRHLLEWTTAAQAAIGQRFDLAAFYRRMAAAVILAGVALLVSLLAGEETWPLALPFVLLWTASPAFALAGSVNRLRSPAGSRCRTTMLRYSAGRRDGRGASSKRSSPLPTTCCRLIIFRKTRQRLRIERPRPTWVSIFCPRRAPAILAG